MKSKIDKLQYFCLLPNLVFAKAIGFTSGILSREVGADNWISMSIGFIIGTAALIVMTYLSSRFPDETIVEYSKKIIGKIPSKIVGVVLSLFFIGAYATSANTVTLHVKQYFLPQTPFWVVCAAYTLLCMYGVFLGAEVIIRYSFSALFMMLLLNVGMILGTIKDFEVLNVLPLFDRGIIEDTWASIYVFSDLAIAILAVGMIYPMLKTKKGALKTSFWSMTLAAFMVNTWPLMETGVLGAEVMKQYAIVCMQQARAAQLTIYLPRYEFVMVVLFVWGAFVQSAIMLHSGLHSFKQVAGLKKDKYMFLVFGSVGFLLTYYSGIDHHRFIRLLTYPWPQICAVLSISIPLLLLTTAVIRKTASQKSKS